MKKLISSGPLPASKKIYVSTESGLKVPMREISIDNDQDQVTVYDTSGPYTDPEFNIDITNGIPRIREPWIRESDHIEMLDQFSTPKGQQQFENRSQNAFVNAHLPYKAKSNQNITQLHAARKGIITPEMEFIATREAMLSEKENIPQHIRNQMKKFTPEFVRSEVASGRAIIPANINHPEAEPMIIGRNFLVKINANIGNSAISSSIEEEVQKSVWATRWGLIQLWIFQREKIFMKLENGFCEIAQFLLGRFQFIKPLKKFEEKQKS